MPSKRIHYYATAILPNSNTGTGPVPAPLFCQAWSRRKDSSTRWTAWLYLLSAAGMPVHWAALDLMALEVYMQGTVNRKKGLCRCAHACMHAHTQVEFSFTRMYNQSVLVSSNYSTFNWCFTLIYSVQEKKKEQEVREELGWQNRDKDGYFWWLKTGSILAWGMLVIVRGERRTWLVHLSL